MLEILRPLLIYLLLPAAFLLGAIPFGFIAGKMRGVDLRTKGSGNIGATNVMRELGKGPGATVLVLDALKGFLPVAVARGAAMGEWWTVGAGLCAILGHIYSPFVRFRGGKGVATSLGVLIGLAPAIAGISLAVFAAAVLLTKYVSFGSILGAVTQAVLFLLLPGYGLAYRLFSLITAIFVIVRHRGNVVRLLQGTESRIGKKKPDVPMSENAAEEGMGESK